VGNAANGTLTVTNNQFPIPATTPIGFLATFINAIPKQMRPVGMATGAGGKIDTRGVATDLAGNIYVVGSYTSPVSFDSIMDAPNSGGTKDGFLVSYTSAGEFRWQRFFSGLGEQSVEAVRVNGNDEIFIAVRFAGNVNFLGQPGTLTAIGPSHLMLAKVENNNDTTNDGKAIWAVRVGGDQEDAFGALATSKEFVILAGQFRGAISLVNGSVTSADIPPFWDSYIVKFATGSGDMLRAFTFVQPGTQSIRGAAVDTFGDVTVGGTFSGKLPPPYDMTNTTGSPSDFDAFVMKFDKELKPSWAKDFGGSGDQTIQTIAIGTSTGHPFVGGGFQDQLSGIAPQLTSTGGFDAFSAELAN
jgi:hypothetical protein